MRLGKAPDARDAPVDRIVADHATGPAGHDEIVARYDPAAAAREGHEDLHNARLKHFAHIADDDFARRRANFYRAKPECGLPRKIDLPGSRNIVHTGPKKRPTAISGRNISTFHGGFVGARLRALL